ncbi:MAG: sialidase-1, partial [Planctomycetota bacterium]
SGPGLEPADTGQLMLVHSDDEGETWSAPRNLTSMLKKPEWSFLLQGPGRGITMGDGTLVFPAQFLLSADEKRLPHSTVITSRDHGETWEIGTGMRGNTTEAAVVELDDGRLMLNARDNRGGSRSIYTSVDLGKTWEAHGTSRGALIEPVCMASLIHIGRELNGQSNGMLLFSNPAVDRAPRRRTTIKASLDSGSSWDVARSVLLDEGGSAGYSCLTMIDAETIGILYESSRAHLVFQRVPLVDVLVSGD